MQLEHILMAHGLIGRGGGKSKDNIPPPPITNFLATVAGETIKLTYSLPIDSDFVGLLILGKNDSYPSGISDGDTVLNKNIEDGGTIPSEVVDSNITLGTRRYYRAFPYDWDKNYQTDTGQQANAIVKISQTAPSAPTMASRTSTSITLNTIAGCEYRAGTGAWQDSTVFSGLNITTNYTFYARKKETSTHYASPISGGATFATDKGTQSAPVAPTISNIEHDRTTVNGGSGTEVRLGSGSWYDSPHIFTGLAEETSYTAYARKKETSTHYASPISSGKNFVTPTAIDPNSWAGIQSIVRRGLTSEYFSVGDQLVSAYDGGEITWEVIGIDVDIPADSQFTHSMTLQTQECLLDAQFDAPEPSNPDTDRKSYGNNRYTHSNIKQWLNSDENTFSWTSQHQYDVASTGAPYDGAGFLKLLDPELASVIGAVDKNVARNTTVDGGGQDLFSEKVFLLSQVETGLGTEGVTTGETVYPFYDGVADAKRIKLLNDSPGYWWLRSPIVSRSHSVRLVSTSGSFSNRNASNTHGVSPACVII